ncbi:hypothetical protein AHF37_06516 [Paragonimus kellicotti]|nr:hypothetical protein AHF37_06516 [Paragonimus kellicotti]
MYLDYYLRKWNLHNYDFLKQLKWNLHKFSGMSDIISRLLNMLAKNRIIISRCGWRAARELFALVIIFCGWT